MKGDYDHSKINDKMANQNPIDSFIISYEWLIRQQAQGVNAPNARTLAQVIRNLFKKEGQAAITKANVALSAEKGLKPNMIPSRRPAGEVQSERRSARLAQDNVPTETINKARLSREQRVAERLRLQAKSDAKSVVVVDEAEPVEQVIEPTVKKGRQKKEVAAPELELGDTQEETATSEVLEIATLNTTEAQAIITMSGRNAVATFGVERIAATLEKMGADHTTGSPNQLANRLIALIADK